MFCPVTLHTVKFWLLKFGHVEVIVELNSLNWSIKYHCSAVVSDKERLGCHGECCLSWVQHKSSRYDELVLCAPGFIFTTIKQSIILHVSLNDRYCWLKLIAIVSPDTNCVVVRARFVRFDLDYVNQGSTYHVDVVTRFKWRSEVREIQWEGIVANLVTCVKIFISWSKINTS